MMLADARLPTGGHTQSGGPRAGRHAGLGTMGAAWRRRRLRPGPAAHRDPGRGRHRGGGPALARAGGRPRSASEPALGGADPEPGAARRLAAAGPRLPAAGRAGLAGDARRTCRPTPRSPRPVRAGRDRRRDRAVRRQSARLVAYDDAQTVVAASLKLLPVDPRRSAPAGWSRCTPTSNGSSTDVAGLTEPDEIPATGAPLVDALGRSAPRPREQRLFHA